MNPPKVSVVVITYNHGQYIKYAIESILMQKISFDLEVVIGEDYSTDNTRIICEEFRTKYPEKIIMLPSVRNLGMMKNLIRTIEACRGQYIAYCEGDDYWTDPLKLQKQVDFLENNKEYSMCFTNAFNLFPTGVKNDFLRETYNYEIRQTYYLSDIIKFNFIPTATILHRALYAGEMTKYGILRNSPVGDWVINFYLSTRGLIGYIDEHTSIRRIHQWGEWSGKSEEEKLKGTILVYKHLLKISPKDYKKTVASYSDGCRYKLALWYINEGFKMAAFRETLYFLIKIHIYPRRAIYLLNRILFMCL